VKKNSAARIAHRLCLLLPSILLLAACQTLSAGATSRTGLESYFLLGREELLARLPDELRRTAVVGENEITVTSSVTRNMYNMLVTIRTEAVYFGFAADRLTRIEIHISSAAGALDPDLEEMRALYRSLDTQYRERLGRPLSDVREQGTPDDRNQGLSTLAAADTSWPAVSGRKYLPGIEVTLSYRERAVQGAGSIRIREVYELKIAGQPPGEQPTVAP
jgi:hypothetical protein